MHTTIGGVTNYMENSKEFTLDQTSIKKLLTIYKLRIPDFQRNFVWKQAKKQQLLESLFRGFPIGAITLYEDKEYYYIIDGLQRINTLNQYLSSPCEVISFHKFYEKIENDIEKFVKEKELEIKPTQIKKCIKIWYEQLSHLYEFEKVSVLYNIFKNEKPNIADIFNDLQIVEDLLEILKRKIEIVHDDIALIIYKGDKNDLPELFKNINTGSVALSQYEILQSVWNDYILDKNLVSKTFDAFNCELELIRNDYEIDAVREHGTFDIFKNIIGLNHIICCNKDCDIIFRFTGFKKLADPIPVSENIRKYYLNDSISFEIYSTILCNTSNQIVKAIDLVYSDIEKKQKISKFINELNGIILEAIDTAIVKIKENNYKVIESKYHSLYILAGIIFANYDIDINNLVIKKSDVNLEIFDSCLDLEKHNKNKWFIDENRQVGFFNIKIEELLDMKKEKQLDSSMSVIMQDAKDVEEGLLKICIDGEIISAYTVKDFYRKIFEDLFMHNIDLEQFVPYATGKKRFLINKTNHHINGDAFTSPIIVHGYYIETHKSKMGAMKDINKFLKELNIDVKII